MPPLSRLSKSTAPEPIRLTIQIPNHSLSSREYRDFPILIGRESGAQIFLEDTRVSRRHAELYLSEGRLVVRDCGSLHGTRVNGHLIQEAMLSAGDVVMVGEVSIRLEEPETEVPRVESGGTSGRPPQPGSVETLVGSTGTLGVLEVIRAIDLENHGRGPGELDELLGFGPGAEPSESADRLRKVQIAYQNLLGIMNLVAKVGRYSHSEQVSEQFASALREIFPLVENVAVVVLAEEGAGQPYRLLYAEGLKEGRIFHQTSTSSTILRRVIEEVRALYAVDARRDPRFSESDSIHRRGVRSMMCAPLIVGGEVLGALYVENLSKPFCFGHFELNMLTVLAFHLAMALRTAGLQAERDEAFERAAQSVEEAKQDRVTMLVQNSQSERKFRALFEQSALGAAVINLETQRVEEVNDGLVQMMGYSRRQLTGMRYEELLSGPQPQEADEWLRHVRRHGEGSRQARLRTISGRELTALQSCRALAMDERQVMVAYFIDVTAQEQAERAREKALARMTALSELSQSLMRTVDSDAIYRLLFARLQSVIDAEAVHVAITDREGLLHVVYESSNKTAVAGSPGKPPRLVGELNALVRTVLDKGESVQIEGGGGLEDPSASDPFAMPQAKLLRSCMVVMLAPGSELRGLVCVQSTAPGAYDGSHLETLRALAGQAALALSNARAFDSIRRQEESLRQLNVQVLSAQETERGRISRELHDGVGQQLTAMKYLVEAIRGAAKSGGQERLLKTVGEASELATQIIDELRNISLDLRPTMLDDLGLKPTLVWLARQVSTRSDVTVTVDCELGEAVVPSNVATTVYRIAQEALSNAAKYSEAAHVHLRVRMADRKLRLSITDDGVGFDAAQLPRFQEQRGSSGMINMRERTGAHRGEFHLETSPGQGTKITIEIPV